MKKFFFLAASMVCLMACSNDDNGGDDGAGLKLLNTLSYDIDIAGFQELSDEDYYNNRLDKNYDWVSYIEGSATALGICCKVYNIPDEEIMSYWVTEWGNSIKVYLNGEYSESAKFERCTQVVDGTGTTIKKEIIPNMYRVLWNIPAGYTGTTFKIKVEFYNMNFNI